MKIENITIDVLQVPVEDAYIAAGRTVDANWHVVARIRTSDGAEGFGYIVKLGAQLVHPITQAARELGESLIGMNVLETEAAWQKMTAAGKWVGPGGLLHWAIAPLDIAMWDAAGKIQGQPLYRLLGGFRDHVPAYASDRLWYSLSYDELAASARNHAAAGYKAIKLRLGKEIGPSAQAERAAVARDAAGTGVAGLAAELDIPVTGGENLYTLTQFRQTLEARAVDIAILDLFRVGGITPWRKIAALAESHRIQISGHVAPEFHVHLLAAAPNGQILEYMPRSTAILQDMPEPVDGVLTAPDRPGHGLSLDEKAYARCRVG